MKVAVVFAAELWGLHREERRLGCCVPNGTLYSSLHLTILHLTILRPWTKLLLLFFLHQVSWHYIRNRVPFGTHIGVCVDEARWNLTWSCSSLVGVQICFRGEDWGSPRVTWDTALVCRAGGRDTLVRSSSPQSSVSFWGCAPGVTVRAGWWSLFWTTATWGRGSWWV